MARIFHGVPYPNKIKKKRKKLKKYNERDRMPYRERRCGNYMICLENAARFDLVLDCTDCPNLCIPSPQPDDGYTAMILEDATCCSRLLKAIFYPQAWKLEERERQQEKNKENIKKLEDVSISEIEWYG